MTGCICTKLVQLHGPTSVPSGETGSGVLEFCSVPAVLCRAGPQVLSLEGCVTLASPFSQIFLLRWEPEETWGHFLLFPMSSESFGYCGPAFSTRVVSLHIPHGKSHQCGRDAGIHYEMTVTTAGADGLLETRNPISQLTSSIIRHMQKQKKELKHAEGLGRQPVGRVALTLV